MKELFLMGFLTNVLNPEIAVFDLSAARLAQWFVHRPLWLAIQRYVMGGVLSALALRIVHCV